MSAFDGLFMSIATLKENGAKEAVSERDRALKEHRDPQSELKLAPADVAAGGCGLAGFESVASKPLRVPPQPALPMRMPRRSRGLDSNANSACSSSTSSQTPPGTPASLSPESLRSLNRFRGGMQPSKSNEDPWWGSISQQEQNNKAQVVGFSFPDEVSRKRHIAAAAAAAARLKAKQTRNSVDYSDYCCFRERGACQAIHEDRPYTDFDFDVMVLELHSLFRRHAIEPSDALVSDMLKWQARATEKVTSGRGEPSGCAGDQGV